jgi:hypothetical protein
MSQLAGAPERRHQPSLFGPIVLIAIGLYFLLSNLDVISVDFHWFELLRLWPLMLIFLGVNIIAQQAPRPFGVLLSGLVALIAVLFFGYVLLYGLEGTALSRLGSIGAGEWQTEAIAFTANNVESAVVDIQTGPPGAHLYALDDSRNLIEGNVFYQDELRFDTNLSRGEATVNLALADEGNTFFFPGSWGSDSERWQVGLNAGVPMELALQANAGTADFDLHALTLDHLSVAVNAGEVELFLPGGDYDGRYQVNAGSVEARLPGDGRHTFEVQVNAGSITLYLPDSMEARVEVNETMGGFNSSISSLRRVSQSGPEGGVWKTVGYDDSSDRVNLIVNISMGSVSLEEMD